MSNTPKLFNYGRFIIQLAIYTAVLYTIHSYIIFRSFPTTEFYFQTWEIYVFQFVTVAAMIYFLNHQRKTKPDKVLASFLILTMIKMGAVMLFLLPLFLNKPASTKATVFSFFAAFFLFLFLETRTTLGFLNEKK